MIIGISGKARHGKNTFGMFVAMHLMSFGVRARMKAFADELKGDASDFGWDGEKDIVGRFALQMYGTLLRGRDPMFWVNRLGLLPTPNEIWIITDVRYKNEAQWIRQNEGSLIRVEKTKDGLLDTDIGSASLHISETELDDWTDWDWIITAEEGDLMELWEMAEKVAKWVAYRL